MIDSGHGIPCDSLPKVFEAFYRVKTEQKRDVKGFGLGLSIVKTLVELHGGQVAIESEEGKGYIVSCHSSPLTKGHCQVRRGCHQSTTNSCRGRRP